MAGAAANQLLRLTYNHRAAAVHTLTNALVPAGGGGGGGWAVNGFGVNN
jgi:hypothetical protein